MKLIDFKSKYDFGHEVIISLLKGEKYSVLQLSLDWNDYGGCPYLQISSGMGRVFSFLLSVGRFGISFDIAGYTWPDSHMVYDEDEEAD